MNWWNNTSDPEPPNISSTTELVVQLYTSAPEPPNISSTTELVAQLNTSDPEPPNISSTNKHKWSWTTKH